MKAEKYFPTDPKKIVIVQPDSIPRELQERPYWACWHTTKKPLQAKTGLPSARVNVVGDWVDFDSAKVAFFSQSAWGMGTLLNGDGLAVVDIDGCIHDGKIEPLAIAVLRDLGVGFVEISPSGTGLHGWGFASGSFRTRLKVRGLEVEFFSHSRFMTVTGCALWNDGFKLLNTDIFDVGRCPHATEETEDKEETEETEETESNTSISSLSTFASIELSGKAYELPSGCVVTAFGHRHKALFALARFVKGIHPNATKSERKAVVLTWKQMFNDQMATKDFGESWLDFEHAWSRVKYPLGESLSGAIEKMSEFEVPDSVAEYGTGLGRLYQLSRALAALSKDGVFFVALRPVGAALGVDHSTLSRQLNRLIEDGVLTVVSGSVVNRAARRLVFA